MVETGEISVFVGRDFVITVRRGEPRGLQGLRRSMEQDPERLALGPSAVLHAIMDRIVDDYLGVANSMQLDVDAVESAVFGGPGRSKRDAERIYVLKREVLELRRSVAPLQAPLRTLSERPVRLVHPEIREYFRDVEDHLARVTEQIGSFDELLTTIIQANLAQVTVEQNEDMRRISAWVAILAIPTAVAGIYGMNFRDMPELAWRYGYPATLLVIALDLPRALPGFPPQRVVVALPAANRAHLHTAGQATRRPDPRHRRGRWGRAAGREIRQGPTARGNESGRTCAIR